MVNRKVHGSLNRILLNQKQNDYSMELFRDSAKLFFSETFLFDKDVSA